MGKNRAILAVNGFSQNIVQCSSGSYQNKVLVDASAIPEGVIIKAINLVSEDASNPRYVNLKVYDGATAYFLGVIPVPAYSGTKSDGTVASVKGLDETKIKGLEKDIQGNYILKLKGGWRLEISTTADPTTGNITGLASYEIITADA